ncbi:MAG TPA: dihydrolipoamide acetyltransferase family protein [Polyangiaceae bacterium]|nr:dihydrolipoamide acetyltransferase family protein [Polyangiaceae bacterium]
MARWEFKLPDIGEGVSEGEIVAWQVAAGDIVTEDQAIVEVMTDKATVTITAPKAGTVVETRGRVGEIVPVHSVLVVFELDVAAPGASVTAATSARVSDEAPGSPSDGTHANGATASPRELAAPARGHPPETPRGALPFSGGGVETSGEAFLAEVRAYYNDKPLATPATRKLARDMNVDLRRVRPSGPQGRVTRRDVEAFGGDVVSTSSASAGPVPGAPRSASAPNAELLRRPPEPTEERVALAGLRRKIAQKMALTASKVASFTFVEECDVTELKRTRERLKDEARQHGAKLSFLPFIVKAVVASLKRHPMLNATLDEAAQEIVLRKYYNIGIATATEAGLMVPVIKDANQKSILDIARDIDRLAGEARAGKARLDDLQGSTFTITSLGTQGGLLATPIVNFPEVAILGVHQMKPRPVVRDGQIAIGDVMLLSLSFDHRVVDGHVGAAFAYDVIGYLEQPERLLLELA